MKQKAIIYGAGNGGKKAFNVFKEIYDIVCFLDNDYKKINTIIEGIQVLSAESNTKMLKENLIIVGSSFAEIENQLLEIQGIKYIPFNIVEKLYSLDKEPWEKIKSEESVIANAIDRVFKNKTYKEKIDLFNDIYKKGMLIPFDFEYTVESIPKNMVYMEVETLIKKSLKDILSFYKSIEPFFFCEKLNKITDLKINDYDPYWENSFFSFGDARSLYSIIATYKPKTILEIGAGNSTKFSRKAICDYELNTKIISIDPVPRAEIFNISDDVIEENIINIDSGIFETLNENDILFIDGSHLAHCGTDVVHTFLNILPKIKKGVLVHIHDISLPFEYSDEYRIRHYNEQYMLASMLLFTTKWEIVLPINYLNCKGHIPVGGASFWIRKII